MATWRSSRTIAAKGLEKKTKLIITKFMESANNRDAPAQAGRKNWLGDLGSDAAKVSLLLYVSGLIASSFYYSRFSILTLDFVKPQCILIGIYIVILYAALPAIILFGSRKFSISAATTTLVLALCLADAVLGWILNCRRFALLQAVLITFVLQFFLFTNSASIWGTLRNRKLQIAFFLPPPRPKAIVFGLLFILHFSLFWFPRIPAHFGGAKPFTVLAITKTADLPANRFVISKNQPKINNSMDSFSLKLLYETDKDLYFVDDLQSGSDVAGYYVMRIKKDEILRMDYITPKWIHWAGGL